MLVVPTVKFNRSYQINSEIREADGNARLRAKMIQSEMLVKVEILLVGWTLKKG